ncbi:hypothetical protein TNCV_2998361 [Trichonephila clavipes]|nr:hypothetical protein TNCV_2998361 [Trichonephila clavipes]
MSFPAVKENSIPEKEKAHFIKKFSLECRHFKVPPSNSAENEFNSYEDFGSEYRLDVSEFDCSDFGICESESDSDSKV